ncbi:MAG: hypothetical protein ACD_77C00201G0001, partial [uncultured bacterium]
VGEVNVVTEMKRVSAVIGGEGNGGVIVPDLHYGRDSLIGTALFLSHLAKERCKVSELRAKYPQYYISKNKIELPQDLDVDSILAKIKDLYSNLRITDIDGIKIDFDEARKWVHLRKSNTEPIIRIYAEAPAEDIASQLAQEIILAINKIINS